MESRTSSWSDHTGIGTVDTKGSAGSFAPLHTPSVATTSHVGHDSPSIGNRIDDVGGFCRSIALCCFAHVAEEGKEEVDNNK